MIVVTTPTGTIGRQVLETLIEHDASLRVVVRDAATLSRVTRSRVEVIEGSHADSAVVDKAFAGADAVFWLVPPDPKAKSVTAAYVDFSRPAAEAIKRHAVQRVVTVSALGRSSPMAEHSGYVKASLAMDDLLASTGAALRALTMPSFMDNILFQFEPIKTSGMFFSPIDGDLKLPSCATCDIAAMAAKVLLDDTWTGQGHIAVLGPEDLSWNDMAAIMSDVLGKPIRFQKIPFEAYKARFIENGMSDAMAQGMTDMAIAKNAGLDKDEHRTVVNTTPTSFRKWCEDVLKPVILG
jgi:uncharacterized protein YbjT (DUF2867 family)